MASTSGLFGLFSSNNDAEVMAQAANFQATQQTAQISIMGMNMLATAQIRSDDLKFMTKSQETIAMQQMAYMNLADARQAANDRRALRNELKIATLQTNATITQLTLDHEAKMEEIKLEAKELGIKEKEMKNEYDLKNKELAQGTSLSSFFVQLQ